MPKMSHPPRGRGDTATLHSGPGWSCPSHQFGEVLKGTVHNLLKSSSQQGFLVGLRVPFASGTSRTIYVRSGP
ncbi:Uncharacterised protein [Mycobacteroides abscessus subsp. massiliense]|nr:Uncharacterised protein [Mycobacteroides abscessus subsp. massiliense]